MFGSMRFQLELGSPHDFFFICLRLHLAVEGRADDHHITPRKCSCIVFFLGSFLEKNKQPVGPVLQLPTFFFIYLIFYFLIFDANKQLTIRGKS